MAKSPTTGGSLGGVGWWADALRDISANAVGLQPSAEWSAASVTNFTGQISEDPYRRGYTVLAFCHLQGFESSAARQPQRVSFFPFVLGDKNAGPNLPATAGAFQRLASRDVDDASAR